MQAQPIGHHFGQISLYAEPEAGADLDQPGSSQAAPASSAALAGGVTSAAPAAASGPVTRTVHQSLPFLARIRYQDADAEPGAEHEHAEFDPAAVTKAGLDALSGANLSELEEGQSVRLPDVVLPAEVVPEDCDTIASTLAYNTTATRSGTVSPFGSTRWSTFNMTGITVTRASGVFTVQATVDNPITYNVNGGSKTSIASENDPALTAANYATAASDLTPNMGNLNGRPPRTQFWAEDLTLRHELFHVGERQQFGRQGVSTAQTWLNTQTAAAPPDVAALLAQVPQRVIAESQANMPYPAKEERAYGDGAPLYQARADAIKTKGDGGGYP
ncbi:MAG: hypothetical protein OHK0022_02860 [Roseiflexaceae bacterium]